MKTRAFLSRVPVKVGAFVLCLLFAALTALSILGAAVLFDSGAYTQSRSQYRTQALESMVRQDGWQIAVRVADYGYPDLRNDYAAGNLRFALYDKSGELLETNSDAPEETQWQYVMEFDVAINPATERFEAAHETFRFCASLLDGLPRTDLYSVAAWWLDAGYSLRYGIFGIGLATAALTVVCFIALMCGAGHRIGSDTVCAGPLTRIPFDLFTTAATLLIVLLIFVCVDVAIYSSIVLEVVLLSGCCILGAAVFLGWCVSASVRVKLGEWWRNTVIWRLLRLLMRGLKALGGGCRAVLRGFPLIWKVALAFGVLCGLELLGIAVTYWATEVLILLWVLEKLILLPAVLYLALVLRKLQKGGRALAQGDLTYQVDTSRMIWDLKEHGENLNSIADGMSRAVEDRMKSERMKTELITNVSHDIKTPLTSIVNYSDLIAREPTDNPKITEYCTVLQRQSDRLKKLIEDLVEASKASSGSMEVHLAPCEAGVMLTQAAGEYEKRLAASGLTLVAQQPDEAVRIMADGRLLWRVFDNLMSNVCKYAQPGTRVYLTLERTGSEAVITFRNTSKDALNISSDELLERFVRGDSARSTEGSGLGLSIAQSLTTLQGGTLALSIDGDLFKVVLKFPTV